MKHARIHLGPVYVYLIITASESPSAPPVLHRKIALHLLRSEYRRDPDDMNSFTAVEQTFADFLLIAEKHQTDQPRITAAADLANSGILILLRLFLKKLGLSPIEILSHSVEFDQLRSQITDLPPEYLAILAGEARLRFIRVSHHQPEFTVTLPCGIMPLTHDFLKNDPPEPVETIALRDHLSTEFDRLQWHRLPENILTFSDAGLALAGLIGDTSATGISMITKDQLQIILPELSHNYKNQITHCPGADPDFVDYFLTTALLYEHLLDYLGLERVRVCSQSTVTR